jgi:uncharacterized metal-binding protein
MSQQNSRLCPGGPKLIFACSGAADVGAIADHAARKLTQDGVGRMFCLAGIGGRVSGIMKTTEAAGKILAIDGCELDCVKSCLHQTGFQEFEHLRITDMGMQKGQAAISDENIATVVRRGAALLA